LKENPIPENLRSKHLFLLVGKNPLPNYVAAQLMAKDDATVYLLHSPGAKGTYVVAERLKTILETSNPSLKVIPREIDETDGKRIEKNVSIILKEIPTNTEIGLNYTGGTKPMAVHTYRILKHKYPGACFSYLDAQSLQMFITKDDESTQRSSVAQSVTLSLEDLIELHGYKLKEGRSELHNPDFYLALAQVHANPDGFHEWKGTWDKHRRSKGWLRSKRPITTLPTKDQYPLLTPIIDVFYKYGGKPGEVAQQLGYSNLDSCYNWFDGTWLEEYTLHSLLEIADELELHPYGIELKPYPVASEEIKKPRDFDLDVAAMMGYQLFAISCIASKKEGGETKKHLFEIYVRARQLGGDEARIGLVCCVENPTCLKEEIEKSWDAEGKIEVFGMYNLPRLSDQLKLWFATANKERS
jgi:hypothetical protein